MINHWLNTFLFPREAKTFPFKISSSSWDLSSLNRNLTTGFSGTNDSSRYLLPLNMTYYDLPKLGNFYDEFIIENEEKIQNFHHIDSLKFLLPYLKTLLIYQNHFYDKKRSLNSYNLKRQLYIFHLLTNSDIIQLI